MQFLIDKRKEANLDWMCIEIPILAWCSDKFPLVNKSIKLSSTTHENSKKLK
jgi:hypothetical protein